ncbi:hypothetical protein AKJ60_00040 [candidate division MSBL1 archaeon SCGC-AAA385M11]|nr:hypothetical protein AKJ60_00040 [candidate division MSBL1 archaeon SCGC-AAA385M11]
MKFNFQVTLFRDFVEDQRTSMDIYADCLTQWLSISSENKLEVKEYQPYIPNWAKIFPTKSINQMRLARYLGYPLQAKIRQGDINHILEEGYAHLLNFPLDPKKTIVTIHDLIPLLAWKGQISGMSYPRRPRLLEYSLKALPKAAHIITISHSSKQNLIDYCNCVAEKISVVYYGLGDDFKTYPAEQCLQLRRKFGLPDYNTHVILVSGQEEYKNHETCFQVLNQLNGLCTKPVVLARFGRPYKKWEELINQYNVKSKVMDMGTLPHDKVVELYNCVDCLLFPSWYEGFGRPPLEAMACGTPVVTSNAASLPEVVGDAGLLSAPDDVYTLAHNVHQLLEDERIRNYYIDQGKKRSANFTWKKNIEETIKIYSKVYQGEN